MTRSAAVAVLLCACAGERSMGGVARAPAGADSPRSVIGPAAGRQAGASAARGRAGWLVVWADGRFQRDGATQSVMARRVSGTGTLLDAAPLPVRVGAVGGAPAPEVAACAAGWLVVWQEHDGLSAARVSWDGAVDPEPLKVAAATLSAGPKVACVGDTALVVWSTPSGTSSQLAGARLSYAGRALLEPPSVLAAEDCLSLSGPVVAADGQQFLVAWRANRPGSAEADVFAARLAAGAPAKAVHPFLVSGDLASTGALVAGGGPPGFLVAWQRREVGGTKLLARVVPSSGSPTAAPEIVEAGDVFSPSVAFDGVLFRVAWRRGPTVVAAQLDPASGTLAVAPREVIGAPPLPPGADASAAWTQGGSTLASGPGQVLVAWETPIALRAYPNGAAEWFEPQDLVEVAGALLGANGKPSPTLPLSSGPADQHSPAVATAGGQALVAWIELRDREWSVFASRFDGHAFLDGPGFPLSHHAREVMGPAVAAAPWGWLVAWQEPGKMLAVRVGRDGAVLDASPIVLTPTGGHAATAAFDGTDVLVAWVGSGAVESVRVNAQGQLVDRGATRLTEKLPEVRHPSLACHPPRCILAWESFNSASQGSRVELVVVEKGRPVADRRHRRLVATDSDMHATSPALAATADGYRLAWEEQPAGGVALPNRPMWRRLDADGAPAAGAESLADARGENLGVTVGELDGAPIAAWSDAKDAIVTFVTGALGPGREARLSSGGAVIVFRANGRVFARTLTK